MLDGMTCIYRNSVDLFFYVMGSANENGVSILATRRTVCCFLIHRGDKLIGANSPVRQLILASVMNCLYESMSHILKKNVEKKSLLDNLDMVILALDEICDGGFVLILHSNSFERILTVNLCFRILLESDPNTVVQKVVVKMDDISFNEQTVAQVLQSAREQLKWSLLR